jgi:hypothetical protein
LIFKFLDSQLEDKRLHTEWNQAFPDFHLLLISSWIELWFVKGCSQIYELFHLSKEQFSNIIVALSCILISRHDHVLSLINIHF